MIANWHSQGYHSQGDADDRLEEERPLVKMRRKAKPKVFFQKGSVLAHGNGQQRLEEKQVLETAREF